MKELTISVGITCFLLVSLGPPPTDAVFNNICRLFADGVVLRDPYKCNAYITCTNSVEVSTECPTGKQFSVEKEECVTGTDNCDDPCAPDNDDVWAADPISCNGFYHCSKGVGSFGLCPNDLHFHEDEQQCVYSWNSNCTEKEHNDNYCHIIPNGINFVDEEYCDKYRVCTKRVLQSKSCTSGTGQTYNRETASCSVSATEESCRTTPSSICKKSVSIIKDKFVEDGATCRGYYYCADNGKEADPDPAWGQCPAGLFFNADKQSCMDPILVACTKNRCDGREDMFVNSSTDCTHYLTCQGGLTVAERQCADYNFFDEKRQACTSEVIEYTGCK